MQYIGDAETRPRYVCSATRSRPFWRGNGRDLLHWVCDRRVTDRTRATDGCHGGGQYTAIVSPGNCLHFPQQTGTGETPDQTDRHERVNFQGSGKSVSRRGKGNPLTCVLRRRPCLVRLRDQKKAKKAGQYHPKHDDSFSVPLAREGGGRPHLQFTDCRAGSPARN
jgi:hypothetical protein